MILAVAASIYIPGLFVKPQYDFVYSLEPYYYGNSRQYSVQGDKVTITNFSMSPDSYYVYGTPKLYIHDVKNNTSREVTYDEIKDLKVDSSARSADGFEVAAPESRGGFLWLFGSGSNYGDRFLKGHGLSRKLNIAKRDPANNNFNFLGWVK